MLENIEFRVKYSDVKEDLTISWESLEDMLQEAAILDYDQYGYGIEGRKQNHTAFLLLYLKINMIELPKWNEMITIRTWCNELDKIYCYRNYEIINNQKQVIGTAFNKLLVYDLENKRPKKIDEQLSNNLELYHKFIYDNHANKYNKIEHLEEQQTTNTEYFKIQKHDIDINGHVNNVKYIDFAQNTIEPINNAHNLDACYQKEITELNTIKCIPIKKISIENRMVDLERKMIPVSSSLIRKDYENNSKYMEKFVVSDLKGCGNSSLFLNQNNKIEVIRCQK